MRNEPIPGRHFTRELPLLCDAVTNQKPRSVPRSFPADSCSPFYLCLPGKRKGE